MVESKIQVNQEATKAIQNVWNSYADTYDKFLHNYLLQGFMTLAVQTDASHSKRILEVGCGSGLHSLYLAKTMLQKGSVLVSTDICNEMLKHMNLKFSDPNQDYSVIPGNKFYITEEEVAPLGEHNFDLEEEIKKKGFEEKDRFVFGCIANNEALPFTDETFDCYISNLSLMIVDNYKNQLSEALRVVKQGSKLGFTIWGRRENFLIFESIHRVMTRLNIAPKDPPKKSSHDLGKDPEALRKVMEEMGCTDIRMWYQPISIRFNDAQHFVEMSLAAPGIQKLFVGLSQEELELIKVETLKEYEEKMSPKVFDVSFFEVLVIVATKDQKSS